MQLYNRADIVAFMDIEGTITRMQGFTDLGKSLNAQTYERRYVDEKNSRSDVTGYSTEWSYTFDRIVGNAVHEKLVEIADNELVGQSVTIYLVNLNDGNATNGYATRKRVVSVIPDTDGDSTDAYTYSGTLHASGEYEEGTSKLSADGLTITYTASV